MKTRENKFDSYENTERKLVTDLLTSRGIKDFKLAPIGSLAPIDGYFKLGGQCFVFEVKARGFPSNRYPDVILEVGKIRELYRFHKKGMKAIYINFFKETDSRITAVVYDLSKRFKLWGDHISDFLTTKLLPKTTAGVPEKIEKQVLMLERWVCDREITLDNQCYLPTA